MGRRQSAVLRRMAPAHIYEVRRCPKKDQAGLSRHSTDHVFPVYSIGERRVDALIHVLGVSGSIAAALTLMVMAVGALPALSVASLGIYCAGMMAVFGLSAAYHMVNWAPAKAVLRRLDRAAIYVAIAATYTPFALAKMGGVAGYGLLALVWSAAVIGVIIKLYFPAHLTKTSYALYLVQGWAVVPALRPLTAAVSTEVLFLLALGGVLFTVGVVFHLWSSLKYHNAVWHAFVLVASGCHYAAVVNAVGV